MIKTIIQGFLNKRGYEIVKKPYMGKPFPAIVDNDSICYKTNIGDYYFPREAKNDGVLKTMMRGKVHEPEIIEVAKQYIVPGTAALDVGANFGQMAIIFSELVGPSGKVYAFEGQPRVLTFLGKNIEANKCDNVVVKGGAVYNTSGQTLIFPPPDFNSYNPFSGNAIDPKALTGQQVKTFTIDSMNIPERISFMKVDIQGSDLFAMQGARQTILKNKMPIIFEFEQEFQSQFNTCFQDYVDFAKEIDYRVERVFLDKNYLLLPR